jgi:hypothetical protein
MQRPKLWLGWGGTLQYEGQDPVRTRGNFTESECSLHINALELLGCWYTIRSLLPLVIPREDWHRTHVNCELDNTTAIKYARVVVSRSLRMSRIGARFYDWVEGTGLQLSYRHLRGIYNVEADGLSRYAWAELKWKLQPELVARLQGIWRCHIEIDLFASRHNTQVPAYYSWQHDFDALGVDSLCHAWDWQETLYAYPPVFLVNRILQKILNDETHDLILVLPLWPSQSWWPTLMSILTEVPIILPHKRWITSDPSGQATWRHSWPLMACRTSGNNAYIHSVRYKFQHASNIRRFLRLLWKHPVRHEATLINSLLTVHDYGD